MFIFLALALLLVFSVNNIQADIQDSHHNLSISGPATFIDKSTTEDQICVFCHTPHQPNGLTITPLWNHMTNAPGTYGVYTSPTMETTDIADIGGGAMNTSLLCMTCHDGTVGVNSLFNESANGIPTMGATTELDGSGRIVSPANLGTGATALLNDHPVNFTYQDSYDSELAKGALGLFVPSANVSNFLIAGKVQCASCHDAHDNTFVSFLRADPAGVNGLCLQCHDK